ncbi:hypothetical protein BD769DRAFT_1386140 [Suillus cothurnatus]|nr:hypothetical protein BD769DRAFT_1386140 [Suillus cothurnatus]
MATKGNHYRAKGSSAESSMDTEIAEPTANIADTIYQHFGVTKRKHAGDILYPGDQYNTDLFDVPTADFSNYEMGANICIICWLSMPLCRDTDLTVSPATNVPPEVNVPIPLAFVKGHNIFVQMIYLAQATGTVS